MRRLITLALLAAAFLVPASADAGALLRLTPLGISSSAYNGPTDPVPLGNSGFRLTYHSQGNSANLVNPVLLILGIPVGSSAPTLTIGQTSGFTVPPTTVQAGGTNVYGGSWNTTTGAAGQFNASVGNQDVYQFLGLNSPGGSQNYPNWSGASSFAAWNLFVYSVTFNPQMSTGSWAQFGGSLPVGTYVIGYGCEVTTSTNVRKAPPAPCSQNGGVQGTPFTFAGYVTEVPEPASLSLLIPGAAFFFMRRRKQA